MRPHGLSREDEDELGRFIVKALAIGYCILLALMMAL
jgi:hypothetical protein